MVLAFVLVRCSSKRPGNIGLVDGGLRKCPQSPNCVSSRAADGRHGIAPITFSGPVEAAREKLVSVIASMPRAKIAESAGPYLRAEFSSALFRFVDDAEFLMDEGAQVIHVRSASRVGYSDMGVNRRRVEEIRTLFGGAGNSR
jgi:uncharacterized protein (DUF1499 family)